VPSVGSMRVAVVSESFLPTVNGVTTSVCRVLEHLRDRGHEVLVIAPDAGAPAEFAGFRVHGVPAIAYRQFPVGIPNPQVLRLLTDFAPDVLHAASPLFLGAQAIAAATRIDTPSVAVFQTDVAGYARRNGLAATAPYVWRLVRWIHQGADLTLAPSSAAAADLAAAGVERVARWGRGVDLDRYHPRNRAMDDAVALRRRVAPGGETVVGYVGRIAPEKQLERMQALRGIRGARFLIAGDGPSQASARRALAGMPVTWLGRVGGRELAAAYAAMDVFVHTGTEETFGQTVQEAHASGLPVVAPHAGGPIDLVDHGTDGFLFDPASARDADLRRCVGELVASEPMRLRMGEAGRRAVLGRSWATIGDELIDHYGRAVSARRSSLASLDPTTPDALPVGV